MAFLSRVRHLWNLSLPTSDVSSMNSKITSESDLATAIYKRGPNEESYYLTHTSPQCPAYLPLILRSDGTTSLTKSLENSHLKEKVSSLSSSVVKLKSSKRRWMILSIVLSVLHIPALLLPLAEMSSAAHEYFFEPTNTTTNSEQNFGRPSVCIYYLTCQDT